MSGPRLRIDDIARLAGVSPATVSRTLGGSPRVAPETRARVLAVAARFSYRPSRLGRNLRSGRADTVGVVVSDIENPHFATLVRAAEDALYRRGRRVLLCNTSEEAGKQTAYLQVMAAERVLGVLLSPSDPGDPEIGRLLDLGIPVIAFDRAVADPRVGSVTADNAAAARTAVRLLIGLGHRRIGLIAGLRGVQTGDDRRSGYLEVMAEAGLEAAVAPGDFTLEAGRAAAALLLAARPRPTAILVANNQMTVGALDLLRERRVRVPEKMALVAFDDPPWFRLADPPLTALAQPVRDMAAAAVELLFEQIQEPGAVPRHLSFELELRVRRSSGGGVQAAG